MISVFQVFKIIMGLIISAFILILVMQFSGSYMQIGESSRQVSILVNMKKAIEDVYTTGISTDFEMKDSEVLAFRAPYMETPISHFDVEPIPIILIPGSKFSVNRNEYDAGWWKFHFIEMFPDTKVLFVPIGSEEKIWNTLRNISIYFPSTENTEVKTKIGLGCEGADFWFGWERYKFMQKIIPSTVSSGIEFTQCENIEYFQNEGYIIITISDGSVEGDFTVIPGESGTGRVRIKVEDDYDYYVYKNGLDILSLAVGGRKLYTHMNKKFISELETAINITSRETGIILNDYDINNRCGTQISDFRHELELLKESIPLMGEGSESSAIKFAKYMDNTIKMYGNLERTGCI